MVLNSASIFAEPAFFESFEEAKAEQSVRGQKGWEVIYLDAKVITNPEAFHGEKILRLYDTANGKTAQDIVHAECPVKVKVGAGGLATITFVVRVDAGTAEADFVLMSGNAKGEIPIRSVQAGILGNKQFYHLPEGLSEKLERFGKAEVGARSELGVNSLDFVRELRGCRLFTA